MIYGSCYSIPIQGDKSTLLHLVRRIAGNISPAIISTTAITSALMSLELYKVISFSDLTLLISSPGGNEIAG